jgi:hypothetical protein
MEHFTYDVAFSFLSQDEALAIEISDLLQGRFATFVYSERQKDLAGADGEEKFSSVFLSESRIVAILFRSGWGETKWTRIEQTAIRRRGGGRGSQRWRRMRSATASSAKTWTPAFLLLSWMLFSTSLTGA